MCIKTRAADLPVWDLCHDKMQGSVFSRRKRGLKFVGEIVDTATASSSRVRLSRLDVCNQGWFVVPIFPPFILGYYSIES